MSKKVRYLVTLSMMHGFIKKAIGRGVQKGESPLVLTACILASRTSDIVPGNNRQLRKYIDKRADQISAEIGVKPRIVNTPHRSPSLVQTNAFLASFEWRSLRMKAIKKYGARCQCCGATPADGIVINVDHIQPRKLFPELSLDLNNLQVLCNLCNHGKGNWDQTDWREAG